MASLSVNKQRKCDKSFMHYSENLSLKFGKICMLSMGTLVLGYRLKDLKSESVYSKV